jgi:hypothetical protein
MERAREHWKFIQTRGLLQTQTDNFPLSFFAVVAAFGGNERISGSLENLPNTNYHI